MASMEKVEQLVNAILADYQLDRDIDRQHDQRADKGVGDGVAIAHPEAAHGGQMLIAIQREALGPEEDVAAGDEIRVADGGDHDEVHRIERDVRGISSAADFPRMTAPMGMIVEPRIKRIRIIRINLPKTFVTAIRMKVILLLG